jgi:glycosyltransferase involved in cell wall biosynthesis
MRILYLVYVQQKSFELFCSDHRTRSFWVDALLDSVIKSGNITIALAVPVNSNSFQKKQIKDMVLYGLPNPEEHNLFKKVFKRVTNSIENKGINSSVEKVLLDFKPDIIQIFGSENPFGLICKQTNIPVVIHIQGYLLIWLKKWFIGISKWELIRYSGIKDILFMRGYLYDYFNFKKRADREAEILNYCRYYMGRTDFDKQVLNVLSPGSTYYHCEEAIRKEFLEGSWDFPKGDKIKCVSILKGTTYKGLNLLIETAKLISDNSTISVEFSICGIAENEKIVKILKRKYKTDFKRLGIKFMGTLGTDELVNQLCQSNIYIHPSYIENSPNSVCEAMALGMPVIATNVGGVSSLISNKKEGILVQEGDPYSLAGAIMDLSFNFSLAINLGINARNRALMRHNPEEIVNRLIGIYNTILSGNGE